MLRERKESGLSVKAWGQEQGLAEHIYYMTCELNDIGMMPLPFTEQKILQSIFACHRNFA